MAKKSLNILIFTTVMNILVALSLTNDLNTPKLGGGFIGLKSEVKYKASARMTLTLKVG